MKYEAEFELAKKVSLEAGGFLNAQTEKKIELEIGKDIKLELDRLSEELIISRLTQYFEYSVLSEEIGLTKSLEEGKPYWIVDPIDGTLNFSRNNPTSCVSIALWMGQEPILGVIYDFNKNELFSGYVGSGAWLNNTVLKQQSSKEKAQSILATGFPTYMSDDEETLEKFIYQIQEYKKIRMIGSAALSLAYVACGRFDAYMEDDIKLWDVAAGVAINKALNNEINITIIDGDSTKTHVHLPRV